MNKKILLSVISASILVPSAAFAGAVTNLTGTDGFSAEPYVKGTNIVQLRLDSAFPGYVSGNSLIPNVSFTSAIADGFDLGISGALNYSGVGSGFNSLAAGALYPWVRAAIPNGSDNIKTGIMVGTSIPLNGAIGATGSQIAANNQYVNAMSAEYFPGVTGLMDFAVGQAVGSSVPLSMGVNAGYARGITSGTNLVSGNLNFTLPTSGLVLYEEQFVNYPVSNYANGGIRLGVSVPVADRWMLDIKPSAIWEASAAGTSWSFNPSVGASVRF